VIPFLNSTDLCFAVESSFENVNIDVSAPSLISYCFKEHLSYAFRCTGVLFFSVVKSHSENQVGFAGAFM